MSKLTEEQRARIDENRRKAQELYAQRQQQPQQPLPTVNPMKRPGNNGVNLPIPSVREALKKARMSDSPTMPTAGPSFTLPGASEPTSSTTPLPIYAPAPSDVKPGIPLNIKQPISSTPNVVLVQKPSAATAVVDPLKGYRPRVTVTFEVENEDAIKVTALPFHMAVADVLKSKRSSRYNKTTKTWTVGFSDYSATITGLRGIQNVDCIIKDMPKWINYVFADKFRANAPPTQPPSSQDVDAQIRNARIEEYLLKRLFPYQRRGVAFGLEKQGRCLIADEMGLGKSLQALAVARAFSNEWPLLILCPSSVKYSWKQQIRQFLPTVTEVRVIEKGSDRLPTSRSSDTVIIMSYDLMAMRVEQLVAANIHVVIFDESHMLKDMAAKRTKAAIELSKKAQRRILLSGTPALSRPVELFPQIRIIDPKIFTAFVPFAERYCKGHKGKWGYDAKGAEHLNELSTILSHSIMIRRLKKDVLQDLPPKTREILYLSGSRVDVRMDSLKKAREAYNLAEKGNDAEAKNSSLLVYFAETGVAKSDSVAEYVIEKYFEKDATPVKLLIFAHHSAVLDTLTMRFASAGIKTIRIDGGTKGTDRENYCKQFQEDPSVKVALLSITAAGVGITLTAANKVIFAELHWNPGTLFQAEDRAHRVGQKSSVYVQYILARNTADDVMWEKIQEKMMVLSDVKLNSEKLNSLENHDLIVDDRPKITDYFTVLEI